MIDDVADGTKVSCWFTHVSSGPEELYCNYQEGEPVGEGQGVASTSPN